MIYEKFSLKKEEKTTIIMFYWCYSCCDLNDLYKCRPGFLRSILVEMTCHSSNSLGLSRAFSLERLMRTSLVYLHKLFALL